VIQVPASSVNPTKFQLPDHTQLPAEDGTFVKNFQEHPQSILLTDSINPLFAKRHLDGQYAIGQDCGIYWRLTNPPEKGAEAPDWFYVPNVPPTLEGKMRRSYVLWKEPTPPMIVIEFVSGNGEDERDRTPITGKFWVYEQVIRPLYYAIYEVERARVELYHWDNGQYHLVNPNTRGHYPIRPLGVELGIWPGKYQNVELPWLRWWDDEGHLLPTGAERASEAQRQVVAEQQRAEEAQRQMVAEQQRASEAQRQMVAEQQRASEAQRQMVAEQQRASEAQRQMVAEQQRAEEAEQKMARLLAQMQALGIKLDV